MPTDETLRRDASIDAGEPGQAPAASVRSAIKQLLQRFRPLLIGLAVRITGDDLRSYFAQEGLRCSLAIPGLAGPFLLTAGSIAISGWAIDMPDGRVLRVRARLGRRIAMGRPMERADVRQALSVCADVPLDCGFGIDVAIGAIPGVLTIEVERRPGAWLPLMRRIVVRPPIKVDKAYHGDLWRYRDWCAREDEAATADAAGQRRYAALWDGRPSVSVIVLPGFDHAGPAMAALTAQTYPAHEIIEVGPETDLPGLAAALRRARGDYCLVLAPGDRLRPDALYMLAASAQADPDRDIVYADEDSDGEGRDPVPFFKPGWSPDTLESFDYLGAPVMYRTELVARLNPATPYDLALQAAELLVEVHHIARVLCRRARPVTAPRDTEADLRALAGRQARRGGTHEVICAVSPDIPCFRPVPPTGAGGALVSIVIPTAGRDLVVGGRRLDLAVDCVSGILSDSTYRDVEIIVVVNPDMPDEKRNALRNLGARLVLYEAAEFNVAAKLNLGASAATGQMLLLLNDDTKIITADWIERLLHHAMKPHVGVVGAKLLYPDGGVQHAGVVTVHGNPNHVRRFYPDEDLGYVFSAIAPRNYGAVTGAVMMTRTTDFRAVGGYSEEFPIHFNDVDYCFKIRRRGLHVVLEPGAKLFHYESASRVPDIHPHELGLFQSRWARDLVSDPFYPAHAFGTAPPNAEIFMRAMTHQT